MPAVVRSAAAIGIAVAIGAGAFIANSPSANAMTTCSSLTAQACARLNDSTPTLRYGDSNADVLRLQVILSKLGYDVPTTGLFGPRTVAEVTDYQRDRGLETTGAVDLATWQALQTGKAIVTDADGQSIAAPRVIPVTVISTPVLREYPTLKVVPTVESVPTAPVAQPRRASVRSTPSTSYADVPVSGKAATAVAFAKAQLGKPYEYGAAGPDSYDCSGLTMAAWRAAGVSIPRTASGQAELTRVSRADIQPGDIIISNDYGHAQIYIGNNQAISAPHTGEYVKVISFPSSYNVIVRPGV